MARENTQNHGKITELSAPLSVDEADGRPRTPEMETVTKRWLSVEHRSFQGHGSAWFGKKNDMTRKSLLDRWILLEMIIPPL